MGKTGYLVLENGKVFRGERFGAQGDMTAEVVFTTGMTGYLETLTDRSYWGQMVVQTFPLIGNYGVIPADFESDVIGPRAYIVKQWCQAPSNFRSEGSLDTFFKERGVIGLSGIDTRALTKIIRETGVMNGKITDDPESVDFEELKAYRVTGAVKASSTPERYVVRPEGEVEKKIALLDFGLKKNIYRELVNRGAEVTVCPVSYTHLAQDRPEGDERAQAHHLQRRRLFRGMDRRSQAPRPFEPAHHRGRPAPLPRSEKRGVVHLPQDLHRSGDGSPLRNHPGGVLQNPPY